MKILMLGWEYPPHISGGLGTACQGLTTSLAARGAEIDFIIPKVFGDEPAQHLDLLDARKHAQQKVTEIRSERKTSTNHEEIVTKSILKSEKQIHTITIPAALSPYGRPETYSQDLRTSLKKQFLNFKTKFKTDTALERFVEEFIVEDSASAQHYGADLFSEVDRFAKNVVFAAMGRSFDMIHAHDWMTYPAAMALKEITGKPLVVHVHSLEFDRSGENVNPRIHGIERAGILAADQVIAVSHYTRNLILKNHPVNPEKVSVVHNGVYTKAAVQSYERAHNKRSKMVLFLGRITFQKGPDYFVKAAARVLPEFPNVTFVMAGAGDMLPRLMDQVAEMGLTKNFLFTGFLNGPEVEKIFSLADLYVMPSVSEPFGIAPLEAISYDVPVIISRQSGVSEVLKHAFKVDFWDVDKLAQYILAVLKYPEIRDDLVGMAKEEVRRLHWDQAAEKTLDIYRATLSHIKETF